jgi:hypothetical protein
MKNAVKSKVVQMILLLAIVAPLVGFTVWDIHPYVPEFNHKYGMGQTSSEFWAYPPVNGYLCADFPFHNPPVYDIVDFFGPPRHEFGYGVRITPYYCVTELDKSQVFLAVVQFQPPLEKYNIKWRVKGGTVIREWGDHNEYVRVKLDDPKLEIYADIPPTNMGDIYYLKYHRP